MKTARFVVYAIDDHEKIMEPPVYMSETSCPTWEDADRMAERCFGDDGAYGHLIHDTELGLWKSGRGAWRPEIYKALNSATAAYEQAASDAAWEHLRDGRSGFPVLLR